VEEDCKKKKKLGPTIGCRLRVQYHAGDWCRNVKHAGSGDCVDDRLQFAELTLMGRNSRQVRLPDRDMPNEAKTSDIWRRVVAMVPHWGVVYAGLHLKEY
jgi:hypothetical protein